MNEQIETNITDAEWEVMRVVWAQDNATSKYIIDVLEKKKSWKPATTKTFIGRLVKKGMLTTEAEGKKFIYSAAVEEGDMIRETFYNLLDHICNRDVGNTIGNMIAQATLSVRDIENLKEILLQKESEAVEDIPCNCVPGQCKCQDHYCSTQHCS
ncbi:MULTISPECIES: CopY/TcrY family copper transport repressor [Exiguobacterium]|uniref:CopY/TcrY family copper transport repressor n=1 Tax=Exiguobacterium acetylicum TaxID=41170 RepID=A0ABX8GEU8_EXIAC|nr:MULTISPECIES: CopY/TcrY family copper transport repressor [Exiguobacterium]QWB31891.1 CopY/TcrY family copper transport repressor [Exiguobacterium acetylicum]